MKEILEDLFKDKNVNGFIISDELYQNLKDYITNLQESEAYYYGQYKDCKKRNEKAIEMFEKAFDYRDNISTNIWEYDGGEEEYIEMLESAYNTLKGDKDE